MAEYRVTFGVKYATEPHPTFSTAHPDGWVTIEAPTEEYARKIAMFIFTDKWAFIYPATSDYFWAAQYPRGEIARVRALVPAAQHRWSCPFLGDLGRGVFRYCTLDEDHTGPHQYRNSGGVLLAEWYTQDSPV